MAQQANPAVLGQVYTWRYGPRRHFAYAVPADGRKSCKFGPFTDPHTADRKAEAYLKKEEL